MIPKVIHYCWFGGNPLPELAQKCIQSWKTYLPEYEIREWNETNFDVDAIKYTSEAYKSKKYAFVSDYARFWILYNHGGLYFDTDVEVIKDFSPIVSMGPFMGAEIDATNESSALINPGLGIGARKGEPLLEELIDMYKTLSFINPNGTLNTKTIVQYTSEVLSAHGMQFTKEIQECAGIWLYPQEYFCPLHMVNNRKQLVITDNTYSIHWWAASWQPKSKERIAKAKRLMMDIFGDRFVLELTDSFNLKKLRSILGL